VIPDPITAAEAARGDAAPLPAHGDVTRRAGRASGLAALAAGLGVLVYVNALGNPFVYDDVRGVVGNASIRELTSPYVRLVGDLSRPVLNLSYAVDYALWGFAPFGYHLTSVLLHALNVALLFALTRAAARDAGAAAGTALEPDATALAVAALFAVHPLQTEAVGYVSGRSEVLCATFFLGALLALRRGLVPGEARWLALGGLLGGLALGAREVAVVLPVVLLGYDRLVVRGDPAAARRRLRRIHVPLLALMALAGAARLWVHVTTEAAAAPVAAWQYLLMQLAVVWRYLRLLALPVGQSVVHSVDEVTTPLDPLALAAGAGLVGVAALAWGVRRRLPLASLGVLWFLALLAPSSTLIPLNEAMAEHRVYLASYGVLLAVVAAAGDGRARLARRGIRLDVAWRATLLLVLAALAALTVERNAVWADPLALWLDAARKAPAVWLPHYAVGEALRQRGDCAAAVPAYAEAQRLRPEEPLTYTNLGACLVELDRLDDARRVFRRALELDPASPRPHVNLGVVAARTGAAEEARRHFVDALARDPRHVLARRHLAALHETAFGAPAEALRLCREIRDLAPDTPGVDECIRRNETRLRPPAG
jgi:tetratricopeptide (TPR) repeat protein